MFPTDVAVSLFISQRLLQEKRRHLVYGHSIDNKVKQGFVSDFWDMAFCLYYSVCWGFSKFGDSAWILSWISDCEYDNPSYNNLM